MTENIKQSSVSGWIAVCASFALIFAFSSVDHAISPMVESFSLYYGQPLNRVLWLISFCTAGIVCGIIAGPALMKSAGPYRLALGGVLFLAAPLALFIAGGSFYAALALRFLFGLGAGVISTVMWWLAYEGVDRRFYTAMITVLMAARPMAVAAGVPLAGFIAYRAGWQWSFAVFLALIILSALFLLTVMTDGKRPWTPFKMTGFFSAYQRVLAEPRAGLFYGGLLLTRICYFGFYSMLGIWMIRYYGLDVGGITRQLAFIGIAETLVNFIIPPILKLNRRAVVNASLALSVPAFAVFVYGALPLWLAVLMIAVFVMLDRVYTMASVMAVPEIFPGLQDKTATGNMVTLTAWIGLTAVSAIEGAWLNLSSVPLMATVLLVSLAAGLVCLHKVQPE